MRTDELDYNLPPELIAQHPVTPRDASRLLVVHRDDGRLEHRHFRDLPEYLGENDCLVLNETQVLPCRLLGEKVEGGARIEVLLQKEIDACRWEVLAYRSRRLRPGTHVRFAEDFSCEMEQDLGRGRFIARFHCGRDFMEALHRHGHLPLPPYVERPSGASEEDRHRYQTVYAQSPGSSAAPTAGLHFTPELLKRLDEKGIYTARVVLHVGQDTFRPISTPLVKDHPMHSEHYQVSEQAAQRVNTARAAGGRIVAVGTTSVRTLESSASDEGRLLPGGGATALFIQPGYRFKMVDVMITNFHLPRTSLLALVSAFSGSNLWRKAYEEAIEKQYRFYSFGDAMLIL
jgi:S-adenosylmethionine:tRNA ribosyltransferase-isomerase